MNDPLVRLAHEVLPVILVLTFFINSLIYLLSPEDED